jgi:hypothetical protein
MFRSIALVAFAVAASAQRWPTITVNSAGDIVLQALTRAASFQLTATSISTGPAGTTTGAVGSGVQTTTAGVALYSVTQSGTGTDNGVSLPAISQIGQTVTFIQAVSTPFAYTVWTNAVSQFINADASTNKYLVQATTRQVTFTAVTMTRWNVQVQGAQYVPSTTFAFSSTVTALSLTEANFGQVNYVTWSVTTSAPTTFGTLNIPACTSSILNAHFTLAIEVTATTGNVGAPTLSLGSATNIVRGTGASISGSIGGGATIDAANANALTLAAIVFATFPRSTAVATFRCLAPGPWNLV